MHRDDGLSPGDIGDPVADSIRAEQNRDAAPSKEEANRNRRNYLAREGCGNCGEDDPDHLQTVDKVSVPSCPTVQQPPSGRTVRCDDCLEDAETLRERALRRAREKDAKDDTRVDAVAFYECGRWDYATLELENGHPPAPGARGSIPATCRCGDPIDDVVYDFEEADDG